MTITAGQVKDLREKTGVGMMECKKALEESAGDPEKAILWLRERGMSRAAKKADRVAAEGMIEVFINEDQTTGALVELNCETDFASGNDTFRKFAHELALLAIKTKPADAAALSAQKLPSGKIVTEQIAELISTIGENINLRRVTVLSTSNGTICGYSHMGGKIGTLVVLEGAKGPQVTELGKDIAMHVAAVSPRYLTSNEVNTGELAQERELAKKKLIEEKKPEAMIEKILDGQMKKFFKEVCLVEQPFVKNPDVTIAKLVESSGTNATLKAFTRFQLGQGIEKKQTDFAAEVAAQLKS